MGLGIKTKIKNTINVLKAPKLLPVEHKVSSTDEFKDKVALITGGSGGIGLAIAKSLSESGCKVIISGTNQSKLDRIAEETGFKTAIVNYSNAESISSQIENAEKIFGHINIFISSAGVHTENVDFWSMTPDEFDRVMDINLKGTYFACQAVGKHMKELGIHGHILLISSSRGSEPAWSPYGISKWGVKGMTEGLAQMLAPYGINVNAIAPGTTATALVGFKEGDSIYSEENGFKRLITPDEVASLAKYLVSDAGTMISGETVHISGGRGTFDIR